MDLISLPLLASTFLFVYPIYKEALNLNSINLSLPLHLSTFLNSTFKIFVPIASIDLITADKGIYGT